MIIKTKYLFRKKEIPEWKKEVVKELKELIDKYKVIAITSFLNVPAAQLKEIRKKIEKEGYGIVKMTKKNLMKIAFKEKGLEDLANELEKIHIPALIFSNVNPFKLAQFLKKNQVPAYAKPNEIVYEDIWVRAGPTDLTPGPIISELAKFGIKTKVEKGKLTIIHDVCIAKKGDKITKELADLLKKLDIKASKIGLRIFVAYEEGIVYKAEDLEIDIEEYKNLFKEAYSNAYYLSIGIYYPTKENIRELVKKCYTIARNVGIELGIESKEIIREIIKRAFRIASALKSKLSI